MHPVGPICSLRSASSSPVEITMRTIKFWPIGAAFAVYASSFPLWAQQQEAEVPPQLEQLDEGEAPAVTIRKPGQERQVTEKRARGGKVTEVQVTSGKSRYYLKPNEPAGSAVPGDVQGDTVRAPQWEVLQFDLRRAKDKEAQAAEAENAPPPPPPANK